MQKFNEAASKMAELIDGILNTFCKDTIEPELKKVCDDFGVEYTSGMGTWYFEICDDNPYKLKADKLGITTEYLFELRNGTEDWLYLPAKAFKEYILYVYDDTIVWNDELRDFYRWYKKAYKAVASLGDILSEELPIPLSRDWNFGMLVGSYNPSKEKSMKKETGEVHG